MTVMNFDTIRYSGPCRQLVDGHRFANRDRVAEFFGRQSANPSGARGAVERLLRVVPGASEVSRWLLALLRDLQTYRPDVAPDGYLRLALKIFDRPAAGEFVEPEVFEPGDVAELDWAAAETGGLS